jgi:hypothetical protein
MELEHAGLPAKSFIPESWMSFDQAAVAHRLRNNAFRSIISQFDYFY